MSKEYVIRFKGDAKQFHQALARMQSGVANFAEGVQKSLNTIGLDSMLNIATKLTSAARQLVTEFLAPAAALEDAATKLGVMFDNDVLGGALAESLQHMATNGVISFQELQEAAGALVGVFQDPEQISEWVGRFADIAAGSKMTTQRLAEMVARLDDMGKAEFTELANAGIPIYQTLAKVMGKSVDEVVKLGAEGKISSEYLLEAFEVLTESGSKFHNLNTEMSNTSKGSWETMLASFQEVLAEIGREINDKIRPILQTIANFLQKYKEQLVTVISLMLKLVAAWVALRSINIAVGVWKMVTGLKAAVVAARTLKAVMTACQGIGGLAVAAITTAAVALWEVFEANKREAEKEQERWEQQNALRQTREEASLNRAKSADADLRRAAELRAILNTTSNLEEFEKAAKEMAALREKNINLLRNGVNSSDNERATRNAVYNLTLLETEIDRMRDKVKTRKEEKEKTAERIALSRKLTAGVMEARIVAEEKAKFEAFKKNPNPEVIRGLLMHDPIANQWLGAQGTTREDLLWAEREADDRVMAQAMYEAAVNGEEDRLKHLQRVQKYIDLYWSHMEELAQKQESIMESRKVEQQRDALVLSGDKKALAAFDDEQERKRLSADYQAAGFSAKEADFYATQDVARKRKIAEAEEAAALAGAQGVQMVASSLAAVGGGGVAHRLGDAQLTVSRKQLSTMESIRSIVSSIATKATGIPVVA